MDPDSRDPAGAGGDEAARPSGPELSRRSLLGGLAGATTAGAALGALPPTASGDVFAAQAGRGAGVAGIGRTVIELVARIEQDGSRLTTFGYMTRIAGVSPAALFTAPRGRSSAEPSSQTERTARFTLYGEATLNSLSNLSTLTVSVFAASVTGTLRYRFQAQGGASFADPRSFDRGALLATHGARAQNRLAIDGPGQASVSLTSDLVQRTAGGFALGGGRRLFGRRGLATRLSANGRGILTEPSRPRSTLLVAGEITVVELPSRRRAR